MRFVPRLLRSVSQLKTTGNIPIIISGCEVVAIVTCLWVLVASESGAQTLLANTNREELLRLNLSAGTATLIGTAGLGDRGWTDIASDAAGNLFGLTRSGGEPDDGCTGAFGSGGCSHLYRIDPTTGAALSEVGETGAAFLSDLDFAPDGTLYANHYIDQVFPDVGGLVVLDPSSAATSTRSTLRFDGALVNGGLSVHPLTGDLWAVESAFTTAPNLFRVDPSSGARVGAAILLGLNGSVPVSRFGLDGLEILADGRFIASESRGGGRLFEIAPFADATSGLAELSEIVLTYDPAIQGTINGLDSVAIPEPGSAALLLTVVLLSAARRRSGLAD